MTSREEMIRQAAVVLTNYLDDVREPGKRHNGQYDETDWDQARAVLDALLPQVTTVEELETLPDTTKAADPRGVVWEKYRSRPRPTWRSTEGAYGRTSEDILIFGPLTVVWMP